jgi:AcrR family transcriptional regulator
MPDTALNLRSTAASPTRRRRAALNKEAVLDTICAVIAERGWESTRYTDVARRANIAIGSLQYLFGSREQMMAAALEHQTRRIFDAVHREAETIQNPVDRLAWIASCLVSGVTSENPDGNEWLIWTEYWRAALRDEKLRTEAARSYREWTALVAGGIEDCVADGLAIPTVDIRQVATGLVALGDGLGVQVSLGDSGLTWAEAGALLRDWLARALGHPELFR